MIRRVAIIGSHGLYANYGGWDQLVNNLAEKKSNNIEYLIFNSSDSPRNINIPKGVEVKWLRLKASGFQGLFFDYWSIIMSYFKVDALLLLGTQGIILIPFLQFFKKKIIVSNVGGVEWERPKFNYFAKKYLKYCFNLSFKLSNYVVLDNEYYKKYLPKNVNKEKVRIIPYGGEIDKTLKCSRELRVKYSFILEDYFLSISRSLEDNLLDELCDSFTKKKYKLVLISNFSKSDYGQKIYSKYKKYNNIVLINGLYIKPELDLIRRKCTAYIHTHTLCGTAPSLVEMIIAQRPIFSIDIPQNRFTLKNQGFFYNNFSEIHNLLDLENDLSNYIPSSKLCEMYNWKSIIEKYEKCIINKNN